MHLSGGMNHRIFNQISVHIDRSRERDLLLVLIETHFPEFKGAGPEALQRKIGGEHLGRCVVRSLRVDCK